MAYNKTPNNEAPELIEKVVYLNRVSKTVKGGRVMKFSALVVVGYTFAELLSNQHRLPL